MTDLKVYINKKTGSFAPFFSACRDRKNISAFGLHFADKIILSSLILNGQKGGEIPLVYVCADYIAATKSYEQFSALSDKVVLLNAKDDVLSYRKSRSGESEHKRLLALSKIVKGEADIIVATVDALAQTYPVREQFCLHTLKLAKGSDYDMSELCKVLSLSGYTREDHVTAKAKFSRRGDIIDIFPIDFDCGVRLEFFGDTLDEIKIFDIAEQTATATMEQVEIYPATEVFFDQADADTLISQINKEFGAAKDESRQRADNIISELTLSVLGGSRGFELSFLMPLLEHSDFETFVKPAYIIFDDAKAAVDNLNIIYTEHENRYKALLLRGEVMKCSNAQFIEKELVFKLDGAKIAFHSLNSANRIFEPDAVFNYKSFSLPSYVRAYEQLVLDIGTWMSLDYRVVLFCLNAQVKQSIERIVYGEEVVLKTGGKGRLDILTDRLDYGAVFHDEKLVLIGTYNLINKTVQKVIKRHKADVFLEPSVGDYVVHNIHGIGFCEKVSRIEINGASRDYFVISYRDGDKLYVPIENMDSLSKYVSSDEPKLNKIGGAEFARLKEKAQSSVKAMAFSLLDLYAARANARGHKYSEDNTFYDEFCSSFEFTETPDQLEAAADGLKDLTDGKTMDRLLCGDVGYGKTEVALRLAFKVITEGRQVAFISPTTILARQHFATTKSRMESFGVRVGSLTRFDSPAQIKDTINKLNAGEIDIVVGTHRVLSNDVVFKNLGFLILDEEQRFGVADKEKIKKLKNNVNVLTLSATPIPRTLHMSMVGIRDISVLDTPPAMRIPIQTYVTEYTQSLAVDAITREVNRGGQVFVVYNRVETIDKFAAELKSLLPELRIITAHGQMQEGKLERIVADFVDGQYDVLVATTIIENGIDMPRANTMLVIDSDRFGLSQLYQLRGRVGRSDKLAYVYFTFNSQKTLTENAYKRLEAITEYTDFGSGFKIAMRDLEIRGTGNILGREQHGHIEKIGYDAYCKLLENAIKELRGEEGENGEVREVKVNTDFNAFIPESYIADNEWRLRAYSRISRIQSNAERQKLSNDLDGIYGKVPSPVENLLLIALVKNLAAKINAQAVTLKKNECSIKFAKIHDIPKSAIELAGSRLKPLDGSIVFGTDRTGMINFLLQNK